MNYVDPPVDPEVHRAARRRRYIESDDDDDDEDEESESEFDSESDENELMREQFPIMQAYRSMTEEDVTESRPGVIVNDIRTDLGRRGVDITPTFQSRVDGAGPVDPRLEVFGGERSSQTPRALGLLPEGIGAMKAVCTRTSTTGAFEIGRYIVR